MMTCRYCGILLADSEFEVCRIVKGKIYRRRKCKRCKHATQMGRRGRLKVWLEEYKKTRRCERCGFNDYRALEFHHPEGADKHFNVGDMVRLGMSITSIRREIAKCEVLCANCHNIEHYVPAEPSRSSYLLPGV